VTTVVAVSKPPIIRIAGAYRSGTNGDPTVTAENLRQLADYYRLDDIPPATALTTQAR
jgi:hypothetical protein